MSMQPRAGISPDVISGSDRNVERRGDFLHGQADEKSKFHQVGGEWINRREAIQDVVERQRFLGSARRGDAGFAQLLAIVLTAALVRVAPARLLDEDAPHGFGHGGEEVATTVPVLRLLHVYK